MKIHELFERKLLLEDAVTLDDVRSLKDLKDPKTKKYYTSEVNVTGAVNLEKLRLTKLPVKFGTVGRYFNCSNNSLTTLEGAPSSLGGANGGDFYCEHNQLTSLQGVHKIFKRIDSNFYCYNNPITSGGIGLLLIEGLKKIYADQPAFKIINRYLGQGKKGLLYCQDELIEAGYEEFAKL